MNKKFWNACLGNLFEHYDAALFGILSPFLADFLFPEHEPVTALILTYAMIPLGVLSRPLGALVFGYIGDLYGRGRALFFSLAGMGVVSLGMALSPTYLQAGIMVPVIFCLGRILQNFFASGETIGGAIFLLENSEEKKHDLLSSLFSASTIGGALLASAGVSILSLCGLISSGWRLLYLFGCITAFFGCMVRRHSNEAQDRSIQKMNFFQSLIHQGKVFYFHRRCLLSIILVSGFDYAHYSISLILMNGFVPLVSSFSKQEMMGLNTILIIFDFLLFPVIGLLSSKISREKMMIGAAIAVILGATPAFLLLKEASLITVILIRVCFVIVGVAFCSPFHSWAQHLVPPQHRYTLISFGYALGSRVLGVPTAAISLWCFQKTGMLGSVAWYWMFLAVLSIIAIVVPLRSKVRESV